MRAECVSEWAVSASRVVGVVGCRRRRNSGVWVGKLLMLLLLEQIVVPVILLPLCVHDGPSKVSTGTLMKRITGCGLEQAERAEGGKGQVKHTGWRSV